MKNNFTMKRERHSRFQSPPPILLKRRPPTSFGLSVPLPLPALLSLNCCPLKFLSSYGYGTECQPCWLFVGLVRLHLDTRYYVFSHGTRRYVLYKSNKILGMKLWLPRSIASLQTTKINHTIIVARCNWVGSYKRLIEMKALTINSIQKKNESLSKIDCRKSKDWIMPLKYETNWYVSYSKSSILHILIRCIYMHLYAMYTHINIRQKY